MLIKVQNPPKIWKPTDLESAWSDSQLSVIELL